LTPKAEKKEAILIDLRPISVATSMRPSDDHRHDLLTMANTLALAMLDLCRCLSLLTT
jgi:hypothetical protein